MSKRFINAPDNVVPELMQGLSLDTSRVTLVDPSCNHAIAVRSSLIAGNHEPTVSVISGGGSGHEPMAAGYVGDGMLAGAVAGSIFSAPSVPAIAMLLDVIAPLSAGILVVVMNYQGDRLNFQQAVDNLRRKNPNYPIGIVMVRDDVAATGAAEPRGIAGTIFVLKVAGAAAAQGRSFEEVLNIAETAARSVASIGAALDPCTIPGHAVDKARLSEEKMELGMGIHNEPGVGRFILESGRNTFTSDLIAEMCTCIDEALRQRVDIAMHATSLAVMVNNLGAVSQAEMLIVNKCVSDFIFSANTSVFDDRRPIHMFTGLFMTSLQMNGISITCFLIPNDNGHMQQLLHAPANVPAWNPGFPLFPPDKRPLLAVPGSDARRLPHGTGSQHENRSPQMYYGSQQSSVHASPRQYGGSPFTGATAAANSVGAGRSGLSTRTEKYIIAITSVLQRHANELGVMDGRTGDGDMGDTVRRGCTRIRGDLDRGVYAPAAGNPSHLFRLISKSCSFMGGTIGPLTMSFLDAAGDSFQRSLQYTTTVPSWRAAVVDGTHAVMTHGGAQIGDRTLIDSLKPAADILAQPGLTLADAARAARVGYESTKSMLRAKYGRSQHLGAAQLRNQGDPGAYAIVIILDALVDAASA